MIQARIQRGGYGVDPPPEKYAQKFLDIPFCCTVEHVQLKNVTVDVMNIIVTIKVSVKCAPECIKMRHFEGENTKIFWRGAQPPPHTLPPLGREIPLPRTTPLWRLRCLHLFPLALEPCPKPHFRLWTWDDLWA